MSFERYITPELVKIDSTVCTRTAVITEITRLFRVNNPNLKESMLFDLFWQREQLGSTAIGHGTALPHIRCPHIQQPSAACMRLQHPIDFGGIDRQPCDLFIALIVPEHEYNQHLRLLSSISEKLQQKNFRDMCRQAQNNRELFEILMTPEEEVI